MPSLPRSRYEELAPPSALAPYVTCLWVQTIGEGEGDGDPTFEQPVLPDGSVDIVSLDGEVLLAGPATRPSTVSLRPGAVTVGVRFRPGAAPPLVGVGAAEIRDDLLPLGDVWGRTGDRITERCADADVARGRLGQLVHALGARLADPPPVDPIATGVAASLTRHPGGSVQDLAARAGISERQLRRRVEAAVGYSPRTLARVLRFQRFLRAARAGPADRIDLARLAAETGYADQAHLTRESRELGGLPPATLLAREAQRLGAR